VGSARRELLDYVIPLNESHLRRLGRDHISYYQQDRTHIGLKKATPASRMMERRSIGRAHIHLHLASVVFITATAGRKLRAWIALIKRIRVAYNRRFLCREPSTYSNRKHQQSILIANSRLVVDSRD
jgi:hypothetical protein